MEEKQGNESEVTDMNKQMSKDEKKEFKKFVEEASKLTDENKRILQAYISGMLAASKASA